MFTKEVQLFGHCHTGMDDLIPSLSPAYLGKEHKKCVVISVSDILPASRIYSLVT